MNLSRRRFLSLLGVPAVVPIACLVVKQKRAFPRYFLAFTSSKAPSNLLVARADSESWVVGTWDCQSLAGRYLAVEIPLKIDIRECERRVSDGRWREITADEAKALLKPKPEKQKPLHPAWDKFMKSMKEYENSTWERVGMAKEHGTAWRLAVPNRIPKVEAKP